MQVGTIIHFYSFQCIFFGNELVTKFTISLSRLSVEFRLLRHIQIGFTFGFSGHLLVTGKVGCRNTTSNSLIDRDSLQLQKGGCSKFRRKVCCVRQYKKPVDFHPTLFLISAMFLSLTSPFLYPRRPKIFPLDGSICLSVCPFEVIVYRLKERTRDPQMGRELPVARYSKVPYPAIPYPRSHMPATDASCGMNAAVFSISHQEA